MSLAFAYRNISRNKWRSFLIIFGIMISVGLQTGIAISIDSLHDDFIKSHRGENLTDITIHPKSDTSLESMKELLKTVKDVKGVKKVSPVVTFTLIDNISSLANIPNNVILYGLDVQSHPDFPKLEVIEGNKTLDQPEVIISQSLSAKLSLPAGVKYSIPVIPQYDFRGVTVTISGVIKDQTQFGNYLGFLFILIDINYMVRLFQTDDHIRFHLAIEVSDFVNLNRVAERLEDTVGFNYYVYREKSLSETDTIAIRSYQSAMNLIIIASFFVEFLFITNILAINIRERSHEFGVMRAVGSSTRQIIGFLGAEILIYSGIGSIIGNLIGIFLSVLFLFFQNVNFSSQLTIDVLILRPESLFSAFMTGILIALVSGLYPIAIATSLPVVQNIHWRMRGKKSRKRNWIYFMLVGILLTIIGMITSYFIGPTRFLEFELISWHFFAVWTIFLGALLVESGILHFLPRIGMKMMRWHKIVPRTIATRNIQRETQKSLITIMVASLALTFVLVMGIISSAIIESVPSYYNERFGRIDIIAQARDDAHLPPMFTNDLVSNNEHIEKAAFIQEQRTKIEDVEGYMFGLIPDTFSFFFEETLLLPPDPNIPTLLNETQNGVIISHLLLNRIGARIGENLSVQASDNSTIQVLVMGIASGNPFLQHGNYMYCSNLLFQTYWEDDSAAWFIMSTFDDAPSLNIVADRLKLNYPELENVIPVEFYSKVIQKSLEIQTGFFQILFIHSFILSGLAQFICILISTMRMEREIGIIRALGLSKTQVFSTFFAESTLLGISGVIVGIINGFVASELLAWYISQSIPIKTNISISMLFYWILVSFGITVLSTILPSYRSSNKDVALAINSYVPRQIKTTPYIWPNWGNIIDEYLEKRLDPVNPTNPQKQAENKIE